MKSNRLAKIRGENNDKHVEYLRSCTVEAGKVYTISYGIDTFFVFTEPATEDRLLFTKYLVRNSTRLVIGSSDSCDIVFPSEYVTSKHAEIVWADGAWKINDLGSKNGTYVNEKRVWSDSLNIGDIVFVMGLKIVVGKQFLALNNPDGKVVVRNSSLLPYVMQEPAEIAEDDDYELPPEKFFYRSPRFQREIEEAEFKIDLPPQSPLTEDMPWILIMGSSMAMGAMAIVTLISAITTKNITSVAMGASMLLGTILLPTVSKKYEKKRKIQKEQLRQKKYREYLEDSMAKVEEECRLQEEILNETFIEMKDCERRILNTERNLWERGYGQSDFLRLRVGHGEGLLNGKITCAEKKFTLEEDVLQDELYAFCDAPKKLNNIPITFSLFDDFKSAVIGKRDEVLDYAKGLIFQIASMYSYDEVKLVILYDGHEESIFHFTKWLPHVWSDDRRFRFVATNTDEMKEVSAYLQPIVEYRSKLHESDLEKETPYYVVFSFSKDLAAKSEMVKNLLAKKENIHFSFLSFYDDIYFVPKESSLIVDIKDGTGKLYDKDDMSGATVDFVPDILLTENPETLSVALANIPLNTLSSGEKLPTSISFLELYDVGKVEHLNALTRWKENDPTKSLEAPIGVDPFGELFKLDLHEKFHGPHGLVAGMTGSGKSEFIITYILSLALNYHPYEVSFILIDYKGGGMAKSFEHLPHTVGIITNLDGSAINRSLVSIESELKRRQRVFAEVSKQVGVSNIDIYKYQRLYREGKVSEPMPHLFIISDEFAELKTQQPEFMEQLVSASRIGRSLGVHLILATQKPSGVVDDQIWSNSKFHVCLKVQDRSDSMDMLKRGDAAELKETGRFYLQVGYNEVFELGQSAWSGAPYIPSDRVYREKDDSIVVIDRNGHVIRQAKPIRQNRVLDNEKQQDAITEYLCTTAEEEGIVMKPLWLPPIPAVVLYDKLYAKYNCNPTPFVLEPLVGEYDDPAHQRQCPLCLPISREGNTVLYGAAGSGKTLFLTTLIWALVHEHTPEEVNLYILDFATESLRAFSAAPHVGEVILSFESEKINNLFKMINKEIARRRKLFSDTGGDYESYVRTTGKPVPAMVVVIDNFSAFAEMYEDKEDAVAYLSREGTKYGLYFVLSAVSTAAVRFRMLQNFKQLLVLQLNDETEYSTVVGKTGGMVPARLKGRGLMKTDAIYEFQTACLVEDGPAYERIKNESMLLNRTWSGTKAKKVPILPEHVDGEFLSGYIDESHPFTIPVGVESSTLNVHHYPFGETCFNLILSFETECRRFVSNLAAFVAEYGNTDGYILDVPMTMGRVTGFQHASAPEACEAMVNRLFELVQVRTASDDTDKSCSMIFINSVTELRQVLSSEGKKNLDFIIENATPENQVCVVIAEPVKSLGSVSSLGWYKTRFSTHDGLWIGSGFGGQYRLSAVKKTAEMSEDLTPEFGFSILKGQGVKIKLLSDSEEVSDE